MGVQVKNPLRYVTDELIFSNDKSIYWLDSTGTKTFGIKLGATNSFSFGNGINNIAIAGPTIYVSGQTRIGNYTTVQKNALTGVPGGLIFDTNLGKLCVYNGASWETITSV